jgi:choline dehydrogenase-like flavoprotein
MIMHCATEWDYDYWAEVTNDSIWNAENMFKNIREFTNVGDETLRSDPECLKYLGTDGPLHVTSFNDSGIIEEPTLMFRAGEAAGYEILKDVNCGKHLGFVQFRSAIKNGERNSAASAFLAPMKDKKNLMILKNSIVKKVLMKDQEVFGVLVQTENSECREFEVHANLEIIISAGAFNSPGILLRSGIGRKVDLDEINVDQVLDLNVGHNYKEHFNTWHFVAVSPEIKVDSNETLDDFENYLQNRKGPLSHIAPESVFFNLNGDGPEPDVTWDYGTYPVGGFDSEGLRGLGDFKEKYFEVLSE